MPERAQRRRTGLVLGAVLILVAIGLAFWQLWWIPRTAFSCDGLPRGASSPAAAAQEFTSALVDSDTSAMCGVMVDKLSDAQLTALASELRQKLGEPTRTDQVTVRIGEQGGSSFPLTLEGPGGAVDLSVHSFMGWYRVVG